MVLKEIASDKEQSFRTLVVVPESHRDGTFERLSAAGNEGVACSCPKVAARAVQLDVRPTTEENHSSVWVAWDSRVVHQGHTYDPHAASGGFTPLLHRPKLFRAEESNAWRASVADEGYVAVVDPLPPRDVIEAMRLLLCDLQHLNPELKSLREVTEADLPQPMGANDLRAGSGICHGEFAWYIRTHPCITKIFERLFGVSPGTPLVGSVDVVALAPPQGRSPVKPGKRWLHLDHTPKQGQIWQTQVQLFPKDASLGSQWERVAVMICKAPTHWCSPEAEARLLACCITGTASRATAGVTQGKTHGDRKASRGVRKEHRKHGAGTQERRIPVKINPEVLDEEFCSWTGGLSLEIIQCASVADVLRWLSREQLRRLVTRKVCTYLSAGSFGLGDTVLNLPVLKEEPTHFSISRALESAMRAPDADIPDKDHMPLSHFSISSTLESAMAMRTPAADIPDEDNVPLSQLSLGFNPANAIADKEGMPPRHCDRPLLKRSRNPVTDIPDKGRVSFRFNPANAIADKDHMSPRLGHRPLLKRLRIV
eukprot:gnl/MRDRNA2_/MRDRNA2_100801_c0_seq1.p1 gnl/MRDRNA2_/MRDRNA2_100801_c0~~gnl/MRDRNA2_/MRDRNA2_100801_c0_seq1.p1  ORF type:complete len:540 (+),score=86.91 gnl/MRDRNA2_/MRDRNA2_100801_c0_seq1:54-1673(+)